MSIIYDVLQKFPLMKNMDSTETLNIKENNQESAWIDTSLSMVIVGLLTTLAMAEYPGVIQLITQYPSPPPVVQTVVISEPPAVVFNEAGFKQKNALNGIFISHDEKIALINNQFFNIGEMVDGMKVISIDSDHVTLQNEQTTLTLRIKV